MKTIHTMPIRKVIGKIIDHKPIHDGLEYVLVKAGKFTPTYVVAEVRPTSYKPLAAHDRMSVAREVFDAFAMM